MSVIEHVLKPAGPLVAGLGAVAFGVAVVKRGWALPIVVLVCVVGLAAIFYVAGKSAFREHPSRASLMMESGYVVLVVAAIAAGGVLFWLAVERAPGKDASSFDTEVYSALVGALSTYLGAIVIKFDVPLNPVKSALATTFSAEFTQRRDAVERDAADAVALDSFGAQSSTKSIDGWAFRARRDRAALLQAAVDAGYLGE